MCRTTKTHRVARQPGAGQLTRSKCAAATAHQKTEGSVSESLPHWRPRNSLQVTPSAQFRSLLASIMTTEQPSDNADRQSGHYSLPEAMFQDEPEPTLQSLARVHRIVGPGQVLGTSRQTGRIVFNARRSARQRAIRLLCVATQRSRRRCHHCQAPTHRPHELRQCA